MTYLARNWPKDLIIIQNFMFWEYFQVSGSDKSPVPAVIKLRFLFIRCPLLFTHWLSLSTIAQMEKNSKIEQMPSKMGVKVSFITSGTQKIKKKKVRVFSVFALVQSSNHYINKSMFCFYWTGLLASNKCGCFPCVVSRVFIC